MSAQLTKPMLHLLDAIVICGNYWAKRPVLPVGVSSCKITGNGLILPPPTVRSSPRRFPSSGLGALPPNGSDPRRL